MKNLPLLLAAAFCVYALVEPTAPQQQVTSCNCGNTKERLSELAQVSAEFTDAATARIEDLEDRLTELEESATASVVTPSGPFFTQWVLSNYNGSYWTQNGKLPSKSHMMQEHGFTSDELAGLSSQQLGKLHGAAHVNGNASTLRGLYSSGASLASSKTQTYSSPVVRKRVYRSYSTCPNGYCPQ